MKSTVLFEKGSLQWVVFGRDPDKVDKIIDTNQYMVSVGDEAILLDPGGVEIFSSMLAAVVHHIPIEQVTQLFASHQDPDIISSLGLWDEILPSATLHSPWLWEGFIRHFGCNNITYSPIPDEGYDIAVGDHKLQLIPAHYAHSSGNFSVYDPVAKILMSGDLGAALLPDDNTDMFVKNFDEHVQYMRGFHQRWLPSNAAKNAWVARVRALDVEMLCPQHGSIFRGEDVGRFLDWLEALEVGTALQSIKN